MKVTTKGIYGLSALIDLTLYGREHLVSLSSIAERQNLSLSYLEQTFPQLKKAGLVKSVLGANGGYQLVNKPEDITIKTILETLDGNLSVVNEKNSEDSVLSKSMRKYIWDKVDTSVSEILNSITLLEIAENYKAESLKAEPMFYI